MSKLIDEIKTLFEYFNNGDYIFFLFFLLSIITIFYFEKDIKIRDFFTWYSIIILGVIWNPICIWVLNKFINMGAMYRIYYMLPLVISIAYALTKIIEKNKNIFQKLLMVFVFTVLIVIFGECIFNQYSTIKVNNLYKLPDETVQVAKIISEDNETTYKKAIVPYEMSSHIRQLYANVELYYTRIISNPKDENGNPRPYDTDEPLNYKPVQKLNAGDVPYITDLAKKNNINYVVFSRATVLSDKMENYGFELYKQTVTYDIYRLNN